MIFQTRVKAKKFKTKILKNKEKESRNKVTPQKLFLIENSIKPKPFIIVHIFKKTNALSIILHTLFLSITIFLPGFIYLSLAHSLYVEMKEKIKSYCEEEFVFTLLFVKMYEDPASFHRTGNMEIFANTLPVTFV